MPLIGLPGLLGRNPAYHFLTGVSLQILYLIRSSGDFYSLFAGNTEILSCYWRFMAYLVCYWTKLMSKKIYFIYDLYDTITVL
jgi:hypothetical protein